MQHRLRVPLAGLATLALLTACGGSPTGTSGSDTGGDGREDSDVAQAAKESFDKFNGMTGQERTDELVACAEEEGQLNVYTSNSDMDNIVDAFTDEYDLEVNVYRASGETVLQRIVQEDEAGYYGADVLENDGLELAAAESEGLLYPYQSELRDTVREEGLVSDAWTATRFNAFVVGWNTDNVAADEVPASLEELAEPQWKGRISMELDDVDWFTALHDYYVDEQGMSEEDYTDLMTRLAANSQIVKGHTTQGELLSAGQFDVAVSAYNHTVDGAADEGAPVTWRPESGDPIQPIVVRPNGVALLKTATNPCAATLFVDFQLTGAQEVFKEDFRIGSISGAEDPLAGLDVYPVPMEKMIEESDTWSKAYEDVVANGQAVE
jgi:iron(III) transport system substrate-binding protein